MNIQLPVATLALVLMLVTSCSGARPATPAVSTTTMPTAPAGAPLPIPKVMTGDIRTHDPGMIHQGQTYYVFSTGDERGLNEGNILIRQSSDLSYWQLVGTVFQTIPAWVTQELGKTPPNLWAPDIAFFNGKYYLYYAGSTFGSNNSVIGLATNLTLDPKSPDYAWIDEGMVLRSHTSDNWNAIDPAFVIDAEAVPWLAFGSFWDGIKMRRLAPDTGKLATDDTTLYALASRGGGPIEAPSIVYHDGYYYLFVSFDRCCRGAQSTYRIMVGGHRVSPVPTPIVMGSAWIRAEAIWCWRAISGCAGRAANRSCSTARHSAWSITRIMLH